MSPRFEKVLVTGGTRGIGRALAEALASDGSEVMVCGRDPEAVRATERELGVRGVSCDVTRASDVARLAGAVRGELAGLDLLVNNAGMQCEQDVVAGIDAELAEREVRLNLLAPVALTSALLPLLLSSPGSVVANVGSALGFCPSSRSPVYAATKAGLSAWTHGLRAQLDGSGVRVVEIVPPVVATQMTVGRQDGALTPARAARDVLRGLRGRGDRILVGKARALAAIHRVSPALARHLLARAERR